MSDSSDSNHNRGNPKSLIDRVPQAQYFEAKFSQSPEHDSGVKATSAPSARSQIQSLLLGGILPVIAFTVIEEYYGTKAGLIAGLVFGVGEVIYEWRKFKKVSGITWLGNGLLVGLGVLSLFTSTGIWYKLQPAIMEAFFGTFLMIAGGKFLVGMAEKQGLWSRINPALQPRMKSLWRGMSFRLGIFFWIHAGLATWAALKWSTEAWAFLKGIGFTLSMLVYLVAENWVMRYRIRS